MLFSYLLLIVATLLAVNLAPNQFWPAGIFVLSAPVLYIASAPLGLLIFIFFKRIFRWLAVILILCSLTFFYFFFGVKGYFIDPSPGNVTLLSYNVGGLKYLQSAASQNALYQWMIDQNPSILCIQEYPPSLEENILHEHFPYSHMEVRKYLKGPAIFSHFPILNIDHVFTGKFAHNQAIYADMLIHGDTVRIVNVHMESYSLKRNKLPSNKSGIKDLFKHLKNTQELRTGQLEMLLSFIDESPYPLIVAGDFNEPPFSYAYFQLAKRLTNPFDEKGKGNGFTFKPTKTFLRIDHQFVSPHFEVKGFQTRQDAKFSDHKPIIGFYHFAGNKNKIEVEYENTKP